MCAVNNNRRLNSDTLTLVLEQISKSNIFLSDIDNAVELLEKLADILMEIKIPLSILTGINNVNQNSNECVLQNQLQRLRSSSIDLLNCKKNFSKRKDHLRKASKRPSETITETSDAKRQNIGGTDTNLMISQTDLAGMGLLDICYICKKETPANVPRHEFYPWMCIKCGNVNFKKRSQMADLNGKVALVTGGRIKIGFEIVLKLLRCGASVIITTRFPKDARRRFELQKDFSAWINRLYIFQLDLRFISHVEKFCDHVLTHFPKLDIFIQNAAQTIRRPTVYYKSLLDSEILDGEGEDTSISPIYTGTSNQFNEKYDLQMLSKLDLTLRNNTTQLLVHPDDFKYANDSQLSQLHFPSGVTDEDGDQLDLRPKNTWITALDEVETAEMVEVTLANYMSPFILLKKLIPLMTQGRTIKSQDWGFIILVTAMEGKFSECNKTGKHPHTNAAKAALNMLVRTSARHYKKMRLLMNAVDTGWVTDEHPVGCKSKLKDGLKTPLDSVDGAARVLDPILQTINSSAEFPLYGKFLKDYQVAGW